MNTTRLLFILLVLMLINVLAICAIEAVPQETGFDHPSFPSNTMHTALEAHARNSSAILSAGGIFGGLVIMFAVCLMPLGMNRRSLEGGGGRALFYLSFVYTGMFALVVVNYLRTMGASEQSYILGFPQASTWMLFGLGLTIPLTVLIPYLIKFDDWICADVDMQRFETLVAERRRRDEGS